MTAPAPSRSGAADGTWPTAPEPGREPGTSVDDGPLGDPGGMPRDGEPDTNEPIPIQDDSPGVGLTRPDDDPVSAAIEADPAPWPDGPDADTDAPIDTRSD